MCSNGPGRGKAGGGRGGERSRRLAVDGAGRTISRPLNSGGECAVDYRAIGSDFEPLSPGLKDWVRDRLADGLFKADNDLVVPTEGVYGKNSSEMFPIESHLRLAGADAVGHTRYFSSHAVVKQLRSWLFELTDHGRERRRSDDR